MESKKIRPKSVEQMPTADIMRNVLEGEPSGQNSPPSGEVQARRQERTRDIEVIQKIKPTAESLEAEALRNEFYEEIEGVAQVRKDNVNAARLIKQLNDIRMYGTDKSNKEVQTLRDQRAKDAPVNIEGLIPTEIHAIIAYLRIHEYRDKEGMVRMMKEHSENIELVRKIKQTDTILRRGTEMQKTLLRALRRRVRRQKPGGRHVSLHDRLLTLQQQKQEQENMNIQEMEAITESIAFKVYKESFQAGGEEGLRQLQHNFPETYRIAIRHIQRMREQGACPEQ